jgi:hypothetical protein
MTTNDNKPAVNIPPVVVSVKKRSFGDLQPGTLRGRGSEFSQPRPDPDQEILAEVRAMSGKEMIRFLRIPGNREKYNSALANRGERQC